MRSSRESVRVPHVPLRATLLILAGALIAGCSRHAPVPRGAPTPKVSEPAITDGRTLVAAMHRKYGGTWYRTLSFTQYNTLYGSTGRESRTQWLQHASVPGRLRIDYLPLAARSGLLYDGTRVHVFDNGKSVTTQRGINVMLLLTADIFVRPDSESARLVAAEGFDLAIARRDTWEGRPVWVMGAAAGDSTSDQIWVDAARMVPVRVVQNEKRGSRTVVTDTRLSHFLDVGGFPIAMQIELRRDGRLYFREELSNVRVNEPQDEAMFDPASWVSAQPKVT